MKVQLETEQGRERKKTTALRCK